MTIPIPLPVTDEVQLARSILAELAETGVRSLTRDLHLDVLLAFDNLELAARHPWPPPSRVTSATDVDVALAQARDALATVLADLSGHDVEPVCVALAHDHVVKALQELS